MKVLYVEMARGFGGSAMSLLQLAENLPPGWEPTIACSYDVRAFTNAAPQVSVRQMHVAAPGPTRSGRLAGLAGLAGHLRRWYVPIVEACRQLKPDVLHANNSSLGNTPVALVGRRLHIPTISHQRGFEYHGRLNRWALRVGLYAHHVAISYAVRDGLTRLGLPEARSTMIYNPVQPPPREPGNGGGHRPRGVMIAMCSVLLPWKGQEVLLRAVAKVAAKAATPFHVTVAGSAPDDRSTYPAALCDLVSELSIGHLVSFPGHVRDIYGLLAETDIAVHASVAPEPFGRVVAEAMLAGVPVIATDAGGPAEIIENGRTGLLVPMGDAEALAEALVRLIADVDLRREMGSRARAYALDAFDPKRSADKVTAVYEGVLSGMLR